MRSGRKAWILPWVVAAALAPRSARAVAYDVEARTEAQVYDMRSYRQSDPADPVLLPRRRIVQYLSLDAFELITGEDLSFESNLRIFADLGLPNGEAQLLDGVRAQGADLLTANLKYRTGGFEGQLGRQVYVDFMDYMAFDGLRLRYKKDVSLFGLGGGIGAEAYAGLWVKGSSLFSSSVYQPDGTRETDARRLALDAPATDPDLADPEPVVGAKVFLEGLKGFSGTVGYRKAWLAGKTDLERASIEATWGHPFWGVSAVGGLEWDLILQRLAQGRFQVRYDRELYALSVEFLKVTPIFSSESIWYYFANGAREEVRLRGDLTPPGPLRVYLAFVGASYETPINDTLSTAQYLGTSLLPTGNNAGGSTGASLRFAHFHAALDLTYRNGYGGRQFWVDQTGGTGNERDRYTLDYRISIANIADGQNPLLSGAFFGVQVWGSTRLTAGTRLSLVLEENRNPYTQTDTRAFLVFDMRAIL